MAMTKREYNAHKKALMNTAMCITVESLQASIKDEFVNPSQPYLVFDAMMSACEKKLGKREFQKWLATL
jgi:hypothetical protein